MFIIFYKKKAISDFKYVIANVGVGALVMKVLKHIIKKINLRT